MLLKGKHIFIVEDDMQNRIVYKMLLACQGARLEFERSGQNTLWWLRAFSNIDLIILDLMLPNGKTGLDVFEEIRKAPQYNNVPIVAVSAADPAFAIPQVQQKGFDGFISKPVSDQLFPKQLARIMKGEKIWHAGGYLDESDD